MLDNLLYGERFILHLFLNSKLILPIDPQLVAVVENAEGIENMGEADLSIISKGVVKAHAGQNIVFRCIGVTGAYSTSDGYVSHTKIHFKRNQQIVDSSKQLSNSLTVSAAAENTGTVYQCEAENSYGKSLSNEIGIEILCKSF